MGFRRVLASLDKNAYGYYVKGIAGGVDKLETNDGCVPQLSPIMSSGEGYSGVFCGALYGLDQVRTTICPQRRLW